MSFFLNISLPHFFLFTFKNFICRILSKQFIKCFKYAIIYWLII
nr:MAG TPA: hypothetical protein [Caudoviricetes sp.]